MLKLQIFITPVIPNLIMSITICPSCGISNDAGAVYCTECGITLDTASPQPENRKVDPFQELPRPRRFLGWGIYIILSYLLTSFSPLFIVFVFSATIGIVLNMLTRVPYAFYIYNNFTDHEKLIQSTHGYHVKTQNPMIMAILFIPLPIISIFLKFREFRTHLLEDHKNETVIPFSEFTVTGLIYVLPFVLNTLLGVIFLRFLRSESLILFLTIFITGILLTIFKLISEYLWQKSLNIHIQNHIQYLK